MNNSVSALPVTKLLRMVAAVLVGLGIGTALNPTVSLPALGAVPGVAVGAAGMLVGAVLYTQAPALAPAGAASGCGCEGECGCS